MALHSRVRTPRRLCVGCGCWSGVGGGRGRAEALVEAYQAPCTHSQTVSCLMSEETRTSDPVQAKHASALCPRVHLSLQPPGRPLQDYINIELDSHRNHLIRCEREWRGLRMQRMCLLGAGRVCSRGGAGQPLQPPRQL